MNVLGFAGLSLVLAFAGSADAQLTINGFNSLTASLSTNGTWSVSIPNAAWKLGGTVGTKPFNSRIAAGTDNVGDYQELAFDYAVASSNRSASIRAYLARPLVMFAVTYTNDTANVLPFPVFNSYPQNLLHLSYNGMFASPTFEALLPDTPWIFFDGAANTFIVSPASDFMVAATTAGIDGEIRAGITGAITSLPAGMTHRTILAYGQGINQTVSDWGNALTDLAGKQRPANDADLLLKSISYWTDNGSTYYYNAGGPSYTDTLKAVKAELNTKSIKLGSMQLDSWWYPKGPDNAWSSHGGLWMYTASTAIFQPDLTSFQKSLGVPLTVHSRWIDEGSPYHGRYKISGSVATDPQYWEDIAAYMKSSGVATFEQDWLALNAQTEVNLTDPAAFLDNMAQSMATRGITMQYCMATPKHFLQSTNYSNLTTIRTSQDGFMKDRWTAFLYSSRLASALGIWPFSDVLKSTERNNLILATLSAGPVAIGDALGNISGPGLLKSVRGDGVIVKPDVPATPVDSTFVSDAQGIDRPMVASTYSDFGALRAHYIFAYTRAADAPITVQPSSYGIAGAAYLYDYLSGSGYTIAGNSALTLNLNNGVGYFVLAAVGQTGIAFLGDKEQFVTLGKKRIPAFTDTGRIEATVAYAAGEKVRTLFGYSPQPVTATALSGTVETPAWDSSTQRFTIRVHASAAGTAQVHIAQALNLSTTTCGIQCGSPRRPAAGVNNVPIGGDGTAIEQ